MRELAIELQLGLCGLSGLAKRVLEYWNVGILDLDTLFHFSTIPLFQIFTTMSLFQWFFSSLFILIVPALVFGAAAPVRVKIGTASFSSSTLSLWIAQEQGIFAKHGIEAQTILIRGGPTLVASLMAGDIDSCLYLGCIRARRCCAGYRY